MYSNYNSFIIIIIVFYEYFKHISNFIVLYIYSVCDVLIP